MNSFLEKFAGKVTGVLSGLDRLVLRGSLLRLCRVDGIYLLLTLGEVPLERFSDHSKWMTKRVVQASLAPAKREKRPIRWLPSSKISKEKVALEIMDADGVTDGLICVLTSLEPCSTYRMYVSKAGKLCVVPHRGKCQFLYHYMIHPVFGFMSARVQTWLPFNVQICLNGREWLGRQLDRAGLGYERVGNCFPWLEGFERAQQLMDTQLQTDWPVALDAIAAQINPCLRDVLAPFLGSYYWSVYQSEWATDIVFADDSTLGELFPRYLGGGLSAFNSLDVMRFLGHENKVTRHGRLRIDFAGDVRSDVQGRSEGFRIKHRIDGNLLKAYRKLQNLLRIEFMMQDVRGYKAYRPRGETKGLAWQRLRKGTADLHRRCQISHRGNERYLEALASLDDSTSLGELFGEISRPAQLGTQRVRALNPFAQGDLDLLEAAGRGEFALRGFRNRDLRELLFPSGSASPVDARRQAASITRKIRLLRAHKLVKKVPKTHRYQLTAKGRKIITAVLTVRDASTQSLQKTAA
jgi:hypothetical protein